MAVVGRGLHSHLGHWGWYPPVEKRPRRWVTIWIVWVEEKRWSQPQHHLVTTVGTDLEPPNRSPEITYVIASHAILLMSSLFVHHLVCWQQQGRCSSVCLQFSRQHQRSCVSPEIFAEFRQRNLALFLPLWFVQICNSNDSWKVGGVERSHGLVLRYGY